MTTWTILAAIALGLGAGLLSGMLGVGGGILFVPTLVLLGLGQVEASATSLLAIVPTAAAGAWRQRAYGNLRVRAALVIGVVSVLGAEVGVQIATRIDESVLRRLFGVLVLLALAFAAWLVDPVSPQAASAIAWLNGWCAASAPNAGRNTNRRGRCARRLSG